jgi:HPt (histidine-containing phosphotransfer) domain-containing protein
MRQNFGTDQAKEDTELPARDEAAALAATGGDAALAGELLAILLSELPGDLERISGSLRAGDWPQLADTAHRMRGATGYCGVPGLEAALTELERAARTADAEQITSEARRVEREAERLRRWSLG